MSKIRRPVPVEEYLKLQRRYAHLFGLKGHPDVIQRLQAFADRNIRRYGLLADVEEGADLPGNATDAADLPEDEAHAFRDRRKKTATALYSESHPGAKADGEAFHITPTVGTSRANKTGRGGPSAPSTRIVPPATTPHPAGENIQGWQTRARRAATATSGLAQDHGGQPVPGHHGPRLLPPCETACNRGQLDEAVGINSVEGLKGRGDQAGWTVEPGAEPSGKRVLVAAGPSGLSAAYHLTRLGHKVVINDTGPMAGGMMRFGIPNNRLPRDVLDAEGADPRWD